MVSSTRKKKSNLASTTNKKTKKYFSLNDISYNTIRSTKKTKKQSYKSILSNKTRKSSKGKMTEISKRDEDYDADDDADENEDPTSHKIKTIDPEYLLQSIKSIKSINITDIKDENIKKLTLLLAELEELILETDDEEIIFDMFKKIEDIRIKIAKKHIDYEKYPSILNPKFNKYLLENEEFEIFKIPVRTDDINKIYGKHEETTILGINKPISKYFKHSPTQQFLRNFMSPQTPYRSLLIFHGTGVGKSCTAISIIENLKTIINTNDKKITILKPNEIRKQIFNFKNNMNHENLENQCTGSEYVNLIKNRELVANCLDNNTDCEQLELRIKKKINQFYEFNTYEKWARAMKNEIYKNFKNKRDEYKHKIYVIRKLFDNSVLVIDEAHHMNDENSDGKTVAKILRDILIYSRNMRLILLTATPMYDKARHILSLINYMLINDKREPIRKKIFDENDTLLKGGLEILKEKTTGYISYLRGNNPFDFPFSIGAELNIPKQIFDINNYPEIPPYFEKSKYKMQFLKIIDCKMQKHQREAYEYSIEIGRKVGTFGSPDEQISNMVFHNIKDVGYNLEQTYGEEGLNSVLVKKKVGKKTVYKFTDDEIGKRFRLPELYNYSCKIAKIIENINISSEYGPVLIYSRLVPSGLKPLMLALEMNGYLPYRNHATPYISSEHKYEKYRGDYIIKTGSKEDLPISENDFEKYIKLGIKMTEEKNVKIMIVTMAGAESFSLFGYREVHILDPHYNLSVVEQVIGRTIRNGSHAHLPIEERNVSIYMYAATLPQVETTDLYKYRLSEKKAITTGIIEKMLKENAIDCELNKNGNYYSPELFPKSIDIITSHGKKIKYDIYDKPFSRYCHYLKDCEYKCICEDSKSSPKNQIELTHVEKLINNYIFRITDLILLNYQVLEKEIADILNIPEKHHQFINIAIEKINSSNKIIFDTRKNKGYIRRIGNFIKFIPIGYNFDDIEFIQQYINNKNYKRHVNLKEYINSLTTYYNKNILIEYNYDDATKDFAEKFKTVKSQNENDRFNFKMTDLEIYSILFICEIYEIKFLFIKNILLKVINGIATTTMEDILYKFIEQMNIIKVYDVFYNLEDSSIYGFVIANSTALQLYRYDKNSNNFIKDISNLKKVIEMKRNNYKNSNIKYSNIYGFIRYTIDDKPPVFKIFDAITGVKKSQTGIVCKTSVIPQIIKYINYIYNEKTNMTFKNLNKEILCHDMMILFLRYDTIQYKNQRWLFIPEEIHIINL